MEHGALGDQLDPAERGQLERVLDTLSDRVGEALDGALVGLYLKGSFALGCGDVWSDVDFLAVSDRPLTAETERRVREVHAALPDLPEHWAQVLEGSYVALDDLRRRADPATPWLYVDNGNREMQWSAHDNTEVFRWVLKNRAITVSGVPAAGLVDAVPVDILRDEAVALAASRTSDIAQDMEYLENAWGQPHEVLTRCRILCTVATGTVVGKVDAARWCLDVVPERWHHLIERAVADRPEPWARVHRLADPALVQPTWEFVRWVTDRVATAAAEPVVAGPHHDPEANGSRAGGSALNNRIDARPSE